MSPITTALQVNALCAEIHADNVAAGWWSNLTTGERMDRNVGELLMLCVSEVCEGAQGYFGGDVQDDKLPHRKMIEVELADFLIRVFDIGGGLSLDLGREFEKAWFTLDAVTVFPAQLQVEGFLLRTICLVSEAMEHDRKGRRQEMAKPLALAIHGAFSLADTLGLDVMAAVAEKRAFNKTRSDHQIANRKAVGGKVY